MHTVVCPKCHGECKINVRNFGTVFEVCPECVNGTVTVAEVQECPHCFCGQVPECVDYGFTVSTVACEECQGYGVVSVHHTF